jgi:perosamine synthetase
VPNWILSASTPTLSARYAIGLALRASGLQSGEEILVPRMHCVVILAPIIQLGLVPVFYDLDENLEPVWDTLFQQLNSNTKLIVIIHFFGKLVDASEQTQRLQSLGVKVLWDCAHAWLSLLNLTFPPSCVDFIVCSTVKFQPSRDGGLLISLGRERLQQSKNLTRSVRAEIQSLLSVTKRILRPRAFSKRDLTHDSNATNAAPDDPLLHERAPYHFRSDEFRMHGTVAAWQITKRIDWAHVSQARIRNYNEVRRELKLCAPTTIHYAHRASQNFVPYVLPIFIEKGTTEVHRALRNAGIQSQRWDVTSPLLKFPDPRTFQILFLPCHERINDRGRSYMLETVIEALEQHA